jgi:hypothetical protein
VKLLIRIVMGLVALAAAALSFQSLMHLGELSGYGVLSFAYPVVLDLGAVASCAAWIHERSRQALGMTWGLLAASVVLNGTVHYLTAERIAPSWLLVVAVAAVPPAVLGLVVHLAVGDRAGAPNEAPAVPGDEDPVAELRVRAVEIIESTGGQAGRNTLAKELGVSPWKARKLLDELGSTNGHGGAS